MIPDKLVVGPYLWPRVGCLYLKTDVAQLPLLLLQTPSFLMLSETVPGPMLPPSLGLARPSYGPEPQGGLGCGGMPVGLRAWEVV